MREQSPARGSACRHDPRRPPAQPVAVLLVSRERGKEWIACACERAEAKGVCLGMGLAHAQALLRGADVWVQPFTPEEDAKRLRRLALWAQRFSPTVAADAPDGLLLDVAGCEHLFGGDGSMVAQVDRSLRKGRLSARLALAPTVGCAWAMARFNEDHITIVEAAHVRDALAPLSVAGLRIDPVFVTALHEVGIERIGSLLELPREELACRFGADLLRRLDQATGITAEAIVPERASTPPEVTRMFDGAVTSLEAITLTVRELLFALVLQLEERGCGARTLEVVFQRLSAEPWHITLMLTYPCRSVRHLWTLLGPRLERVNMGYGVESVVLRALRMGKLSAAQMYFAHGEDEDRLARDEAALGEFVDRLIDRFGSRGVLRISPVATHVPEEAFPLGKWSAKPKRRSRGDDDDRAAVAAVFDRPSQLLTVPEPVQVISLVPDGPPSWLHWRGREFAVRCAGGPERIALPWWRSKRDGPPSPDGGRDYYVVQDDCGRFLWVYRDRATKGWFVHGLWA